jgi:ABC-type Na+ transport system ATPase subunit NatA
MTARENICYYADLRGNTRRNRGHHCALSVSRLLDMQDILDRRLEGFFFARRKMKVAIVLVHGFACHLLMSQPMVWM